MAQLKDTTITGDATVSGTLLVGSNNLNVAEQITNINNNLKDSVVEQGTSGIWTYRKWASGISECWATTTTTISSWEAWGNLYEGYPRIEPISFPKNLFISDDVGWQVTANSYMGIVSVESASLITKSQTPLMWLLRPNTSSSSDLVRISMEAKGRWK